jgi:hypothetical protein
LSRFRAWKEKEIFFQKIKKEIADIEKKEFFLLNEA